MRSKATVLSFTLLSLSAAAARAADDNGPVFSGFAETTYNYNFNGPASNSNGLGHSFDSAANTFALNNAQLLLQGNPKGDKDVSYVLKVDYGTDATKIDPSATGLVTVQEAYGTYTCPDTHLGLKAGKFVTYEGIEVVEANADPTITRGLLFNLAEPVTHTGAVATYVNGKFDFAAGLVNGWDLVTDNNSGKTFIFKGTYSGGDPLTLTLSGIYGAEKPADAKDERFSLDLTGLTKVVQNLDLNFQLNYGSEGNKAIPNTVHTEDPTKASTWFGLGVQPVYHVNKKFSIAARVEWFNDPEGARTGTDKQKLTTFSVCPGYQVTDHFLARAEIRIDRSNKDAYEDKNGVFNKKGQTEFVAETIFSF
jgi:hypothetical protein